MRPIKRRNLALITSPRPLSTATKEVLFFIHPSLCSLQIQIVLYFKTQIGSAPSWVVKIGRPVRWPPTLKTELRRTRHNFYCPVGPVQSRRSKNTIYEYLQIIISAQRRRVPPVRESAPGPAVRNSLSFGTMTF